MRRPPQGALVLLLVWCFDLGLHPLLAKSVDDGRQVLLEHLSQLALYFSLYEVLNDGDRVKGRTDVDVLQRVGLEDYRDAFLLRDHEDHIRRELEVGESEKHWHHQGLLRS